MSVARCENVRPDPGYPGWENRCALTVGHTGRHAYALDPSATRDGLKMPPVHEVRTSVVEPGGRLRHVQTRHVLKCWADNFHNIRAGVKRAEVRRADDRDFHVDDFIELHAWADGVELPGVPPIMARITKIDDFAGECAILVADVDRVGIMGEIKRAVLIHFEVVA